jgi:hypothetical protein
MYTEQPSAYRADLVGAVRFVQELAKQGVTDAGYIENEVLPKVADDLGKVDAAYLAERALRWIPAEKRGGGVAAAEEEAGAAGAGNVYDRIRAEAAEKQERARQQRERAQQVHNQLTGGV